MTEPEEDFALLEKPAISIEEFGARLLRRADDHLDAPLSDETARIWLNSDRFGSPIDARVGGAHTSRPQYAMSFSDHLLGHGLDQIQQSFGWVDRRADDLRVSLPRAWGRNGPVW